MFLTEKMWVCVCQREHAQAAYDKDEENRAGRSYPYWRAWGLSIVCVTATEVAQKQLGKKAGQESEQRGVLFVLQARLVHTIGFSVSHA